MKRCPNCHRTYTDEALNFCLEDGVSLVPEVTASPAASETLPYDAPPTVVYRQGPASNPSAPLINQVPPHQGQWSPMPPQQSRKSSPVWWILGGVAVLAVIGVGVVVMLLAIASINSQSNTNRLVITNTSSNRNGNSNRSTNANLPRANSNSNSSSNSPLPASFSDDFSQQRWSVSNSEFGQIWYDNDEYHMRSKDKTYVVMYAPSNDYNTENATVKITARNVDGISPSTGYGLVVHGEKKDDQLEDYAFLIFTGTNPQYKVLMHKGGTETKMVDWTPSNVIRQGTSTNELEVRIRDTQLAFLINGQLVTAVSDTANFKRGKAGLYTSDAHEVAFDDLQITR